MRAPFRRALVVAGGAVVLLGSAAGLLVTAPAAAATGTPALTTTPAPTAVALGTAPAPTLKDSAVLTGGSSPTGTITFTLSLGASVFDTETVTVSGDGTYKTPTGFTTSTPGTYQWDATYSGDLNNNPVSDFGNPDEQVVVNPASPVLRTTPDPVTATLGTSTPPTLADSAVLSGGFSPTGTLTFTLFQGNSSTPIDTETVTVSGNGTYKTPTGFTTSTTGTYQWDATYSGDASNNPASDTGNPHERVLVNRWRVIFRHHVGPPANFSNLVAVTATGEKDAWAFGASDAIASAGPVAYRWQGRRWQTSTLPGGLGTAVGAASEPAAGDVWALGPAGYVLHFNGARWRVAKRFTGNGFSELSDIVAFSPANVWVFGGPSARPGLGTFHFNGRSWTKVGGATKLGLFKVSALSARDMWATGTSNSRFDSIDHYTGTWRRITAAALKGLTFFNVMALAKNNVWAVAESGSSNVVSYLVHFDGHQWVRFKPPWTVYLSGMAQDGHGGIWLTGIDGSHASWVVHRSASAEWQRILISKSSIGMENLVKIPGTSSLWAVGSEPHGPGTDATAWELG